MRTRSRLQPFDKKIFSLTIVMSVVGLIIVSSASVVLSFQRFGYNTYYLSRQAMFVAAGLIIMLALSRVDYRFFKRFSPLILLATMVALMVVLIPGIGFKVGNARRWIDMGFTLLQPSEFAKLAVILYLAAWFESRAETVRSFFSGIVPPLLAVGLVAGLVIIEPDFGSMSAVLLIAFAMLVIGGVRLSHLITLVIVAAGFGWLAVQAAPYRMERILTFLNRSTDPLGAGYQINQALLAIGSGGLWGLGFGHSRQKFNFLPEPIGDSIFAITAEELGYVRVVGILLLFLLFAYFGYSIARRAPDRFGSMVAAGITSWIVIQAVVNVSAMVGLLPLTGIPLPFISYGGSSIIALMCGIGILLNISRQRV